MNRRQFCALSGASLWTKPSDFFRAGEDVKYSDLSDQYQLWSLLIPKLCRSLFSKPQTGGVLILDQTFPPDAPPSLIIASPLPGDRNVRPEKHGKTAAYQTQIPKESYPAFTQALQRLQLDKSEELGLERHLLLSRPYRLISQDEALEFLSLTPAMTREGWQPDPQIRLRYKGFHEVTMVSKPYFDRTSRFAMVWLKIGPSCSLSGWFFFKRERHEWRSEPWTSTQKGVCDGDFFSD